MKTPEDFCHWLQGFFELRDEEPVSAGLSAVQTKIIREHLALVFTKVTGATLKSASNTAAVTTASEESLKTILDYFKGTADRATARGSWLTGGLRCSDHGVSLC